MSVRIIYLVSADRPVREDLLMSPFFFRPNGKPVFNLDQAVEKFSYDGGSFAKYVVAGNSQWLESKADGSSQFRFTKTGRDKDWIRLFDSSRGMAVRLPVNGGMCSWSTDDGKTWNALYRVNKTK